MSSHSRATDQGGGDRLFQPPSRPQRPARQPLGVKNSMASSFMGTEIVMASEKPYASKPNPTPHLLPSARIHRPAVASPAPMTSNSTSGTIVPTTSQRFYASHQPSPLGMVKGIEVPKSDEDSSEHCQKSQAPLSPSIVKTPKKRAIPLEDVHVRNTVPGQRVDPEALSQSPNPNKRSRSSKHGSSATDPSTSTSLSIATGLGDVNLQSQGGTAPAPPTTTSSRHQLQNPPPLPSLQHMPSHSQLPRTMVPPPHPRPTTTRIDKQSRMTENDRILREKVKMENQKEWRKKFLRAFPQFRFHLDGFDESTRKEATTIIEQLGGSIEPFFSNNVSHLVTTRKIPVGVIPEANTGPLALTLPSPKLGLADHSTSKMVVAAGPNRSTVTSSARPIASSSRFSRLPALRKKNTSVPLHSDRNPFEECGPPLPANDILNKARSFGIKVWTLEKFRMVMSSLIGVEDSLDSKKQQNLSQMLEKEKVQGTLEKDPLVGRDNFHYFSKNSVYILIEDATAEHRPIMVQEWNKPTPEDDRVDWPILYGELEGRCPFNKIEFEGDVRKRMKPNRHETLKRSVSLSHLNRRGPPVSPAPSGDSRGSYSINRGASPYPLASGNSVSLTSNIASTTSTNMGGPTGLGLIPPYGALGRKVHQAAGLGLGRPSSIASNARSGHSSTTPTTISEQSRGSLVRRMLGITDHNRTNLAGIRRSVSTASAGNQLRREKKPGYCENCRSKYEDFDEHIAGRKHRKFAEDDSHFADIDTMLNRVARPIAAWAMESSTPASAEEVEFDATSTSSLLAAGGSLLEVEGAEEVESAERRRLLYSPRGFRDAMHQWQQGTQTEQPIAYTIPASTPFSRHHQHHQPGGVLTTTVLEGGDLNEYCEEDSTSSHGDQTAGNTTATTVDHQTEEDMVSVSPDTSPHVHHQQPLPQQQHHHRHHHHTHQDNHQYHRRHQKQEQEQEQDNEYTASYYGTAI